MEPRKNPDKDYRKEAGLFFNIGLVVSLLLCITAFEWKFEEVKPTVCLCEPPPAEDWYVVPPTIHEPPKPKVIPKEIEEVPNDDPIEQDIIPVIDPIEIETLELKIETKPEVAPEPEFVIIAEEMPSPIGGYSAFYNFLAKSIKYPRLAIRNQEEGKVFISFIVEKDGSLSNLAVVKGIGYGCNEEAIRVLKKFPGWNPGKQRYQPVRVKMVLPITFKLK